MKLDISDIRKDFPILSKIVHGQQLVYFDNGATTQKPQCVIDAIVNCYTQTNSNIHRGVHFLSEQSTEVYEEARHTVQQFISAEFSHEVIFTSGTTGSINAIAFSFGDALVNRSLFGIGGVQREHQWALEWVHGGRRIAGARHGACRHR